LILNMDKQSISSRRQKSNGGECLLVIFRPTLALAKNIRWPLKGFTIVDKQYSEINMGDWTGFYDWLRDSESNLLGIRYSPFKDCEFLIEHARELSYVTPDFPRNMEVYFFKQRSVEPQLSHDQDFAYDAIFRSQDGEYAMAFGIDELSESDLRRLNKAEAEWVVARPQIQEPTKNV
jgi:hypothetical protein